MNTVLSIITYLLRKRLNLCLSSFQSSLAYLQLRSGAEYVGPRLRCYGIPFIDISPFAIVRIGHKFVITNKNFYNSIGVSHESVIKVFPNAFLTIGNNVGMSSTRISCTHGITIGDNVLIGADTLITDSDAHPINKLQRCDPLKIKSSPIVIESDVFIGAKCIILKGSFIGSGSVVGAGSVVSGLIEPNSIFAGNPAEFMKSIL
jgi:acetyltransferase-like isoleucine patch superfamily enzyme